MPQLCLVACSNFRAELAAIVEQAGYDDVCLASFAPDCLRPVAGEDRPSALVAAYRDRGYAIAVLGGACLARLAQHETAQARIYTANTCMELVAGAPLVELLLGQGAYLMTPGWLACWQHNMREWGFDQETARVFFSETTQKLTLLDTGVNDQSATQLQALGDFLQLPTETVPVGLELLRLLVTKIVLEWRWDGRAAGA